MLLCFLLVLLGGLLLIFLLFLPPVLLIFLFVVGCGCLLFVHILFLCCWILLYLFRLSICLSFLSLCIVGLLFLIRQSVRRVILAEIHLDLKLKGQKPVHVVHGLVILDTCSCDIAIGIFRLSSTKQSWACNMP